jgi:hypothetical protein
MQSADEIILDQEAADPAVAGKDVGRLDPVTADVLMQVMTELANMLPFLGKASGRRRVGEIQEQTRTLLHQISKLIAAREINPWTRLRLSSAEPPVLPLAGVPRVGIFPIAANPIHWGDLLSGLSAMAAARLDKILFVLAPDSCPPSDLYPEEMRRSAAAEAIALFQPLFALVPAFSGKSPSAPACFFRLLGLNGQQKVEAWYISKDECASRESPAQVREALMKERGNGAWYSEKLHPASVAVIDANAGGSPVSEGSRMMTVHAVLPGVSSAAVRAALRSPLHRDELAALPACAFRHLRMLSAFD